jgi:hypothetical protein
MLFTNNPIFSDFVFSSYLYINGANLAVNRDFASFIAGDLNAREAVLLKADGTYTIHSGSATDLRNFYHNGGLYTAGRGGVLTYNEIGGSRTQLATVNDMNDVFVYEDQLYGTNWDLNSFFLAKVGTGTPTSGGNTMTTVVPAGAFPGYNSQFTYYKKDSSTTVLYVSNEGNPNTIRRLGFIDNQWVTLYSAQIPTIALTQVAFENDDGTTTVLVHADRSGIYRTIDDGTGFSTPELWLDGSYDLVKGIAFAPSTCHNGVMDGTETGMDCGGSYCPACPPTPPVAVPVNAPVSEPVTEPVSTPIDPPVSAPVESPVAGPTSGPVASPMSVPQSANTPTGKVSSGLVSVETGVCTVLAATVLMVLV